MSQVIQSKFKKKELYEDGWDMSSNYETAFIGICLITIALFLGMLGVLVIVIARISECSLGGFNDDKAVGNHTQIQVALILAMELCIGIVITSFVVRLPPAVGAKGDVDGLTLCGYADRALKVSFTDFFWILKTIS